MRIKRMTDHLKMHKKDKSSTRGLITLLNRRRRMLAYLDKRDPLAYERLTLEFGIRRGTHLRAPDGTVKSAAQSAAPASARAKPASTGAKPRSTGSKPASAGAGAGAGAGTGTRARARR